MLGALCALSVGRLSEETTRQKTNIPTDPVFKAWLAGVIDGDGSFELYQHYNYLKLNAITIKMDLRDINVLYHIQNTLKLGRVLPVKGTIFYFKINLRFILK
ncbi:MAG: LAGLIDADG family homing endonuclease [Candidatus Paceibacteria bacterium]